MCAVVDLVARFRERPSLTRSRPRHTLSGSTRSRPDSVALTRPTLQRSTRRLLVSLAWLGLASVIQALILDPSSGMSARGTSLAASSQRSGSTPESQAMAETPGAVEARSSEGEGGTSGARHLRKRKDPLLSVGSRYKPSSYADAAKKGKGAPDPPREEKRLQPFVPHPSSAVRARVERALVQRLYLIERLDDGEDKFRQNFAVGVSERRGPS